jgi:hypothetical protein
MVQLPNKLISMLTDYGFKVTFGNQRDTTFIRNALPLLMKSPMKVTKVKHLPTEIVGMTESSRKGFYDTFLRINNDLYVIVEMQLGHHTYLLEITYHFCMSAKLKKVKTLLMMLKKFIVSV